MSIKPFKDQDYETIRNECLKKRFLFNDPYFPADMRSIYRFNKSSGISPIANWVRPFELVENPCFIDKDINARDLFQGEIADCWFISGTAAVADVSHEHIRFVVPENQTFDRTAGYCGIFHFRFWKFGQWYDVVVDDRLPVNHSGMLIFCSNKRDLSEFWGPLIEKAYAKLASCFDFLNWGCPEDAIINMTGGVSEFIHIPSFLNKQSKEVLWEQLYRSYKMGSPSNCSIPSRKGERPEFKRDNGLVNGHAYSIRKLVTISSSSKLSRFFNFHDSEKIHLIKIRNPWGNEDEWNGLWSDKSPIWDKIDVNTRNELGLVKEFDGEFWMSFDDFIRNFVCVSMVHIDPNAYIGSNTLVSSKPLNWKFTEFHGESIIDKRQFWLNTQFLATFKHIDSEHTNSLIVSLMCKESIRELNGGAVGGLTTMHIHLFHIIDDDSIDDHKASNQKYQGYELKQIFTNSMETPAQEFTRRFNLNKGSYVIIAFAEFKGRPCNYYLRLLTEEGAENFNSHMLNVQGDDILEGGEESEITLNIENESWRLSS